MKQAFGDEYNAYLNGGIPFYIPDTQRSVLESTIAVAYLEGAPQ